MIDNRGNLLTNCLCNSLWSLPNDIYVWLSAEGLMKRRLWTKGGHNSRRHSVSLTLITRLYSSLLSSVTPTAVKQDIREGIARLAVTGGRAAIKPTGHVIKRSSDVFWWTEPHVSRWCYEVNMQISSHWLTVSDHLNVSLVSSSAFMSRYSCGEQCVDPLNWS